MTIEPANEFVAVVVCSQCVWSLSASAATSLGHLDNSEQLEAELAHHKAQAHPAT